MFYKKNMCDNLKNKRIFATIYQNHKVSLLLCFNIELVHESYIKVLLSGLKHDAKRKTSKRKIETAHATYIPSSVKMTKGFENSTP